MDIHRSVGGVIIGLAVLRYSLGSSPQKTDFP